MSQDEKDEYIHIRQTDKKKRNGDTPDNNQTKNIAKLEATIKKHEQMIASMNTNSETSTLPPQPSANPLRPPSDFTQRGGR